MNARDLADIVSHYFQVDSQIGNNEILFTLELNNDRSQVVMLSLAESGGCEVIKVKSRCCVVNSASMVRSFLRNNLSTVLGGYSLDMSTSPHVIDLAQKLVVPQDGELNVSELTNTISTIAYQADAIEQSLIKDDIF